jgi:hypothetical protein
MHPIDLMLCGWLVVHSLLGWIIGWKRMIILCGFTVLWTGLVASLSWTIGQPTGASWHVAYQRYLWLWGSGMLWGVLPVIATTPWQTIMAALRSWRHDDPWVPWTHAWGAALGFWYGGWIVVGMITPIIAWQVDPWVWMLEPSIVCRHLLAETVLRVGTPMFPEWMVDHVSLWVRYGRLVV